MTQEEMEKCKWRQVRRHVWLNLDTEKYHFSCETDMLDETPYETAEACDAALKLIQKLCEEQCT